MTDSSARKTYGLNVYKRKGNDRKGKDACYHGIHCGRILLANGDSREAYQSQNVINNK